MNGQQILDDFRILIEDSPSDDECLLLANTVISVVEGDRPWRMLLKEDSTKTFGAGETYLTSKDLPSDFLYDVKLKLGKESANDYIEYDPCEFEERRQFNGSRRYAVDMANKKYYICGTVGTTYTIYLYYIYETDPITLTTSPVWPVKFQRLIPLLMASIWKSGIDADIFNISQALEFSKEGQLLYKAMIAWDSVLKLKSMNSQTPIHSGRTREADNLVPDLEGLLR